MNLFRFSVILTALPMLAACGRHGGPNAPVATISGSLNFLSTDRSNDTLEITLVWVEAEEGVAIRVNNDIHYEEQSGKYQLELMENPPDTALRTDEETGGKLGFANIFAYDDPFSEGPLDLTTVDPDHYGDLLYRFRGGSSDVLLGYAADEFPSGTELAERLGGPIEPGFFLVGVTSSCQCTFNQGCVDTPGGDCEDSVATALDLDTAVKLEIVNDYREFQFSDTPWWL